MRRSYYRSHGDIQYIFIFQLSGKTLAQTDQCQLIFKCQLSVLLALGHQSWEKNQPWLSCFLYHVILACGIVRLNCLAYNITISTVEHRTCIDICKAALHLAIMEESLGILLYGIGVHTQVCNYSLCGACWYSTTKHRFFKMLSVMKIVLIEILQISYFCGIKHH